MNEIRQARWRIRHYFHVDPDELTLRGFFELASAGSDYIRSLTAKPPPTQAPTSTETFSGR